MRYETKVSERLEYLEKRTLVAYENCRRIARRSGSNFTWAFSLLRPDHRRAMEALYAFARLVDDWADSDTTSRKNPRFWFDYLQDCLKVLEKPYPALIIHPKTDEWFQLFKNSQISGGSFASPSPNIQMIELSAKEIQPAVIDLLTRFGTPIEHLFEIVQGICWDTSTDRIILNLTELEEYCYLVASSVGLSCLSIWNGYVPDAVQPAIRCGYAFQFTNILRDVREDALNGRIYLPQAWLAEHHIDRSSWLNAAPKGCWEGILIRLIQLAKEHFEAGWRVYSHLQPDGQRMFSLIWNIYRELLATIERNIAAVWQRRVSISSITKIGLYLQHSLSPVYFQATQPFSKS